MSEPTKDDLLKRLADAGAEWDAATMGLIWLELGELLTALEAREDQAAAALREATEALTGPEAGLAAIDEETAATDRERLARLASAEDLSLDADKRGLARAQLGEWEADLTRLRQKRDWAEAAMQPLVQARDQARMVLAQIQGAKRGVMWAQLNPFTSPVAQATKAYIGHRQPFLNLVLLKNDRSDPEWEAAISEVEECCLRSAYRTDHLPSEAEQMARAMTASMADATSEPPPPAPSGRDVMKAYEIEARTTG